MSELFARIKAILPNAEPHSAGQPDYDSADIAWGDGYIIVTPEFDGYLVGIYTTEGWESGDLEAMASLIVLTADEVVELVDYLTEYQPEGTDWSAWAAQRIADGWNS